MDCFQGLSRLFRSLCVALAVLALGAVASVAVAADTCTGVTEAQALADCQSQVIRAMAAYNNPHSLGCHRQGTDKIYVGAFTWNASDGSLVTTSAGVAYFSCDNPPPSNNPCGEPSTMNTNYGGKLLSGMTQCHATPQPDGSSVQCGFKATPITPPVQNDYGNWTTYITYSQGGDVCSGDGTNGNSWTNSDGTAPADPPPAKPVGPPTDDPPKVCGNESCYDPKTGQYCAQGDSGQVCTSGAPPNPGASGSCSSGGDATICAGSPQAPKPPTGKVPDPPTQTQGTDNYTHADPASGEKYNTTVTTYTTGPGSTSSGAKAGDSQPAHSSSSGGNTGDGGDDKGDDTKASGGGDCSNPPSVEGNAALAMIATQTWMVRCDGIDKPDGDSSLPGLDAGVPDAAGTGAGVKDGGSILDRLDFSGLVGGGATCPQPMSIDIPEWGFSYHTAPDTWCTVLNALGLVLMFAATYRALTVLGML